MRFVNMFYKAVILALGLVALPWAATAGEAKSNSTAEPSTPKVARTEHYWLDFLNLGGAGGFGVAGVQVNFAAKNKQWMVSYRVLDQDFLFIHRVERGSGEAINGRVSEYGLSRMWHRASRGGYFNASVGLSVLRGDIGSDCAEVNRGWGILFSIEYECRREQFTTLGVPLRLSAGGGRYAGLAVHLDVNLNLKKPFAGITLSIPIGSFAR